MKRTSLKLAAAAVLAAGMIFAQGTSTPVQPGTNGAQAGQHGHARPRMRQLWQSLNLTDTQKQQAKAIFQQAHQTAQPIRQQLQQNRQALRDAVKTSKGNEAIQQLATEQGSLHGQLVAIRTQAWAQFYSLLTPEQRTQADQLHR